MTAELPEGVVEAVGPVRPGDTLLFRVDDGVRTPEQFQQLVDEVSSVLEQKLPGVEFAFVAGVGQILHYTPNLAFDPTLVISHEAAVEGIDVRPDPLLSEPRP